MTDVELPALDGTVPLGFLAGLGTLRLFHLQGYSATLAWDERTAQARLGSDCRDIDDVVEVLQRVVDAIPDGGVIPGVPPTFPPKLSGISGPDPMYAPDGGLPSLLEDAEPGDELERWFAALVTDLPERRRGPRPTSNKAVSSLMTAPTGRQTARLHFQNPLEDIRRYPTALREALAGWRRYSGVIGEGFDHQARFDGADVQGGEANSRGVPGATWLAAMSLPIFRTTVVDGRAATVGWRTRPGRLFQYPLWSRPLDIYAVGALLQHPTVMAPDAPDRLRELGAVGVTRICLARRRRAANSDGWLGPA